MIVSCCAALSFISHTMNPQPSISIADDSYPIYIRKLPSAATIEDVERTFKRFGAIKEGGVSVTPVQTPSSSYVYGIVEFEDPISMEKSIKNSPVTIRGDKCDVEKLETSEVGYPRSHIRDRRLILTSQGSIISMDSDQGLPSGSGASKANKTAKNKQRMTLSQLHTGIDINRKTY